MDRRDFLKSTAAVAVVAAFPASASARLKLHTRLDEFVYAVPAGFAPYVTPFAVARLWADGQLIYDYAR